MIPGYNSITQAFLGTLFTWALTAVGSGLVFVFRSGQVTKYINIYIYKEVLKSFRPDQKAHLYKILMFDYLARFWGVGRAKDFSAPPCAVSIGN